MAYNPASLDRFKPAVGKTWLYLLAGVMWMGIGIMLIGFASRWLKDISLLTVLLFISSGIGLASLIYYFGFSKMAKKNARRILAMEGERICLFAFQAWKTYPLVIFMIALGIYLRIYSPIPKPLLAILYIGIGGGLSLSSIHYFKQARES